MSRHPSDSAEQDVPNLCEICTKVEVLKAAQRCCCEYPICVECKAEYVRSKVKEGVGLGVFQISCPNLRCVVMMTDEEIRTLLVDDEMKDKFGELVRQVGLCQICGEVTSTKTSRHHCGYVVCQKCLQDYVRRRVSEGVVKIRCPNSSCLVMLGHWEIVPLLSEELTVKYEEVSNVCPKCGTTENIVSRQCCFYLACHDCKQKYVSGEVSKGEVEIGCPNTSCSKMMSRSEIRILLSDELTSQYDHQLAEVIRERYSVVLEALRAGLDRDLLDEMIKQICDSNPRLPRELLMSYMSSPNVCTICCELDIYPTGMLVPPKLRGCCKLVICGKCMKQYVASSLSDGIIKIGCPNTGCKKVLHREEVRNQLDEDETLKYDQLVADANEDPSRKTCPRCSHITEVLKSPKSSKKLKKNGILIKCQACNLHWCFTCHAPWHEELSCKQFQAGNKLLKAWAKNKQLEGAVNAQKCPKCKFFIQKSEGCDHMTCSRCGTNFCYRCGEIRRKIHPPVLDFLQESHDTRLSILGCKTLYQPKKPVARVLARGSIFAAKVLAAPVVLALAAGVSVIALPIYGGVKLHQHIQRRRRERLMCRMNDMGFIRNPQLEIDLNLEAQRNTLRLLLEELGTSHEVLGTVRRQQMDEDWASIVMETHHARLRRLLGELELADEAVDDVAAIAEPTADEWISQVLVNEVDGEFLDKTLAMEHLEPVTVPPEVGDSQPQVDPTQNWIASN